MTPDELFKLVERCELTNQLSMILTMPKPKKIGCRMSNQLVVRSPFGDARILNWNEDRMVFMVQTYKVRKWLAKRGYFG